jgi:hypothetical protein
MRKVHTMTMGSHMVDGKYKCSTLETAKVPAKDCKNNKILCKIKEVWTMSMRSTHGDEGKYK